MPNEVTITLVVDNQGAIVGVKNTEGAFTRLRKETDAAAAAADRLARSLQQIANRGARGAAQQLGEVETRSTRTSQALRSLAGSVGIGNVQFLGLARLGVPGILAAIGLAVGGLATKFSSIGEAARFAGENIQLFADKMRRLLGLGESDALLAERIREEQKLLLPILEQAREARHRAAIENLGFAANESAARRRELDELQKIKEKRLEDLEVLRQGQRNQAAPGFGPITASQAEALAAIDRAAKEAEKAIEDEHKKRLGNIQLRNAKQFSDEEIKIRRDAFEAIQQAGVETEEGLTRILNQNIVNTNRILREEVEIHEKTGKEIVELTGKRTAEQIRLEHELKEFRRRNAEETRQIEEDAALATLSPWQRSYAEIIVQAERRQREIEQQVARTVISEQDGARRVAAIWVEAAAKQREALAGTLEDFASGPMEFFKRRWKQMLFQMMADAILASSALRSIFGSIFGIPLGGGRGAGATAGSGGGLFGGILGGIFGGGGGLGGFGTATTPPFNPGASFSSVPGSIGGISPLDLVVGTGSLTGVPLSGGGGVGLGSTLPAGGSSGGIGALLKANLPSLAISGGLLGASAIGFGSPLRGGISGALLGGLGGFGVASALGLGLVAGPIGLVAGLVGAAIGAIFGIFGRKKKQRQRDAIEREAFRGIEQVKNAYNVHQLDYNSAIAQLEQIREQVNQAMAQLKWPSRMDPHIDAAIRHINQTEEQRFRNAQTHAGLPRPEFAIGGVVPGFPGQPVPITAHGGETILNPLQKSLVGPARVDRALRMTGAGTRGRGGSFAGGGTVAASGVFAGGNMELHVHLHGALIDGEGVKKMLREVWPALQSQMRRTMRDQGLAYSV